MLKLLSKYIEGINMKGLNLIKFIKRKKPLKIFLILLMVFSAFTAINHSKRVEATSNTGSIKVTTQENNFIFVGIDNFDANCLESFTVTLKQGENVKGTWEKTLSSDDSFSNIEHTFHGLEKNTTYTLEYDLLVSDDDSVFAHSQEGTLVYIRNTKRLVVTKAWDDNDDEKQIRPSAEEFKNMMKFSVGGVQVTPRSIEIAEIGNIALPKPTDENPNAGVQMYCYKYYVYGIDLRQKIDVSETTVAGYARDTSVGEASSTDGFLDDNGNVNYSSATINVSTPNLANTIKIINIKLKKVDEETNEPLENVEFEIRFDSALPTTGSTAIPAVRTRHDVTTARHFFRK